MKKAILRFDTSDDDIGKLAQIHISSLPDNLFIPVVIETEPKNDELQEVVNHLRDRIKDINHEITIPQSNEAKCFLDGKRKAFQYVLDLLEIKRSGEE